MVTDEMDPIDESDVFLVALQGHLVGCITLEDAIAIKDANGILSNTDDRSCSPFKLGRLVMVLKRYGCLSAAEELERWSSRLRAEQLLGVEALPNSRPNGRNIEKHRRHMYRQRNC